MRVRDVMSRAPLTVTPKTAVGAALRLLADNGVTALPVVDASSRIVGIVSEFDLILGRIPPDPTVGAGARPFAHRNRTRAGDLIEDVMSHSMVVVHPETDLEEVARIVASTSIKSFPVVDATDQVVGIMSRSDVVRALARDDDVLEEDISDALARAGLPPCRPTVRHGVVHLQVAAGSAELERVLELVTSTPGVTSVHAY